MSSRQRDISGLGGRQRIDSPTSSGNNYLLAVAIDDYKHHPKLYSCVKDANDIIRQLVYKYNFEQQHVVQLFNQDASLDNIYKHISELSKVITEKDNLIIFFAGHGYYDKDSNTGHLIPVNAERKKVWDYLSNSNFLDWVRAIKSMHTLVILDSCFSGSMFSTRSSGASFADSVSNYKSRWGLAAGRIEAVDDGMHGENSPFAKAIVSFLKENTTTKFPVSDLIQYVKKVTANNSGQTPIAGPIKNLGDEGGEFVFELKTDVATEWKKTIDDNTAMAYRSFISNYPESVFVDQATAYLLPLRETEMWAEIQRLPHKELSDVVEKQRLISEYKFHYPHGKYGIKANELLVHLKNTEELLIKNRSNQNHPTAEVATEVQPGQSSDNHNQGKVVKKVVVQNNDVSNSNSTVANVVVKNDNWWTTPKVITAVMIPIITIAGFFAFTMLNKKSSTSGERDQLVFSLLSDSEKVDDYAAFIKQFPRSEYISEVQALKADLEYWQIMVAKNNINGYESYILLYGDENGRFLKEAEEAIKLLEKENELLEEENEEVLEDNRQASTTTKNQTPKSPINAHVKTAEDIAWNKIKNSESSKDLDAVRNFINKYGSGKYQKEATTLLSALTVWENKIKKDHSVKNYREYIKSYPNGPHKRQAQSAVEALKTNEDDFWKNTKSRNSEKGYQKYLRVYPNSKNDAQAKKALKNLKNTREKTGELSKPSTTTKKQKK